MIDETSFPRITALLTAYGYSRDELSAIVPFARGEHPRQWITALVGAAAERARYQQALQIAFPPAPLTQSAKRA